MAETPQDHASPSFNVAQTLPGSIHSSPHSEFGRPPVKQDVKQDVLAEVATVASIDCGGLEVSQQTTNDKTVVEAEHSGSHLEVSEPLQPSFEPIARRPEDLNEERIPRPVVNRSNEQDQVLPLMNDITVAAPGIDKGKGRAVAREQQLRPLEQVQQQVNEIILQPLHQDVIQPENDQPVLSKTPPQLPPRKDESASPEKINYLMKTIAFNGGSYAIICQSHNGACPILSIANFLSLSSGIKLPKHQRSISASYLSDLLADYLIANERDLSVLGQLEGLHNGLNVDPQFTGVSRFLDGQEIIHEFGGELLHGWIPSPEDQACGFLTTQEHGFAAASEAEATTFTNFEAAQMAVMTTPDSPAALAINEFFLNYPNNMTPTGLRLLHDHMKEGEISILFYNSHFSLLYKHPLSGDLYTLVTDAGYIESGNNVVWESLVIGEASQFFSSEFIPRTILGESLHENDYGQTQQIDRNEDDEDAKYARRLHEQESGLLGESDAALAKRLQAEEDAESSQISQAGSLESAPDTHRRREILRIRAEEDQRRVDQYNGTDPRPSTRSEVVRTPANRTSSKKIAPQGRDGEALSKKSEKKKGCILM